MATTIAGTPKRGSNEAHGQTELFKEFNIRLHNDSLLRFIYRFSVKHQNVCSALLSARILFAPDGNDPGYFVKSTLLTSLPNAI